MALVMRDSIDAPLIPRDTPVVAGYGDGKFIWSPNWRDGGNWFDLFPNSVKLVIAVFAQDAGDILDVETGDARPDQVPDWCARFNRPGRRAPTIYCNRATWPLVIDALASAGTNPAGPHVDWWIATLDGTTNVAIPPGGKAPALVQVVDTGAYDESIILDPSWVGLGGPEVLDPNDPVVQEILLELDQVYWLARTGYDGDPNGTPPPAHFGVFKDVPAQLAALQTAVAGLSQPIVDVNALAAALIPHLPAGTDPAVVAQDVVKQLAAQLGKS